MRFCGNLTSKFTIFASWRDDSDFWLNCFCCDLLVDTVIAILFHYWSDDEEIPSDDEEIPSDEEEISSDDEIAFNKVKKKQNGGESQSGSQRTKRKIEESEFDDHLAKRHKDFEQFRNNAIQKWHDRTKLSSGKISSKVRLICWNQCLIFIFFWVW